MAGKKLVIVESPAKARTIKRMLGGDYEVTASMGHVRDLPERTLGIDIRKGFAPVYEETRSNIIRQLKSDARDSESIYLAPDPDREGEAIAWHLRELLKNSTKAAFYRVVFHEITKSAVSLAFQSPTDINMNLVDAQQARRVLDRLVGYQVSPLLWSKIEKGASAGRVQSVALRLVCEREREIQAFKPREYWVFNAVMEPKDLPGKENRFRTRLVKIGDKKADIGNKKDADDISNILRMSNKYLVDSVELKPQKKFAHPPFITSSLQQAAGTTFRFSASQTMQIAQQLYEGIELGSSGPVGLITYMRTDSFTVAAEAQSACRKYIAEHFGPEYVPEKPNFYKSRATAQGAHEAVRPTDVTLAPDHIKPYLDPNQLKLYSLIWNRFISSQMSPAIQRKISVNINTDASDGKKYVFQSAAVVTEFPGFMKVYGVYDSKEKESESEDAEMLAVLAKLKEGQECSLLELFPEQKFTEPPPHYSEASLIRELEHNGIGRPSTYATIVNTIQKRKYTKHGKGKLVPTELGFKVCDYLVAELPELFQVSFTADMEKKLDKIEEGNVRWTEMLEDFYKSFSPWVDKAKSIGAPDKEKAEKLLTLFDNIKKWADPVKKGGKVYNDFWFIKSVKNQFKKNARVSEKQWNALLQMAVRYRDQLPELERIAAEYGFGAEIAAIELKVENEPESQEMKFVGEKDSLRDKYGKKIFAFFEGVRFDEPSRKGGRVYDDKRFFYSLKEQVDGGKTLTPKQVGALQKIAAKYKDQIVNFSEISQLLSLQDVGGHKSERDGETDHGAGNINVEEMLASLSGVTDWAEPVKKGRKTYDDKAFYESLARQYNQKKTLTDKQIDALRKLREKYSNVVKTADELSGEGAEGACIEHSA